MWKFWVSLLATAGFCILSQSSLTVGDATLPPLGQFLSPFEGFWKQAEPKHTTSDITLKAEGLDSVVTIAFDDRMVPHIFASSLKDAVFAQGYLEARFRLFQMDISTRATAGRLSEILGSRTLAFDVSQRQKGLAWSAEIALQKWQQFPEDFALLEAYAAGANTWIDNLAPEDHPVEFKLLRFTPERWSPYRSALFARSMALRLCGQESDLEHANLRQVLGDSLFFALYPEHNPHDSPIVPDTAMSADQGKWHLTEEPVQPKQQQTQQGSSGVNTKEHIEGSNNWAVSGQKTASGNPILCNDPHLDLTLPSTWYELQIVTPEMNCYGVSLPGIPGILIGWNRHIAWGITSSGQDVLDWHTIDWTDSTRNTYLVDGKTRPTEWRREVYGIRGGKDIVDSTAMTLFGPVQSAGKHEGMAMRWLSHDEPISSEISVFTGLNAAKSYREFRDALSKFYTPAQNFIYADTKGNIGIVIGGRLPNRVPGSGRTVLDGSTGNLGWTSLIPYAENPAMYNPDRQFVASANQESTGPGYPYYYIGAPYFEDYRGRYLNRKLASMHNITVEDMQQLQNNNYSLKAEETVPLLLGALDPFAFEGTSRVIYDSLLNWDYTYRADQPAPVYYEIWWDAFQRLTWDEITGMGDSLTVQFPEEWVLTDLCRDEKQHPFFDIRSTEKRESMPDIVRLAFGTMVDSVSRLPEGIPWGSYRVFTIEHLARLPGFGHTFDDLDGHGNTLNAIKGTAGPSWRMVVDMQDPPVGYVIYPGGQSGNPGSPFYRTGIAAWARGDYYRAQVPKTPDQVQHRRFTITME